MPLGKVDGALQESETRVSPPLTTIRQPLIEMAEAAAELVLGLARGEEPPRARVELATELIVRESTAPPRDAG